MDEKRGKEEQVGAEGNGKFLVTRCGEYAVNVLAHCKAGAGAFLLLNNICAWELHFKSIGFSTFLDRMHDCYSNVL